MQEMSYRADCVTRIYRIVHQSGLLKLTEEQECILEEEDRYTG